MRRREGIGLGDAKLMALLARGSGCRSAAGLRPRCRAGSAGCRRLLAFPGAEAIGNWAASRLPLGTFLCMAAL